MKSVAILAGAVLLACVAGIGSSPVLRIVNGTTSSIEAIPFQVSLQVHEGHSCGGAILNANTILTAAHCFDLLSEYNPIDRWSVRVGSSYLQRDGSLHQVVEAKIHEQFVSETLDYDIALIKVEPPIEFSEAVRPVVVASNRDELHAGDVVQVSGWGRIETMGPLADVLQKIRMPVLETAECENIFNSMNLITERMFCAGFVTGAGDSCAGDSGGPLVDQNDVLYGVVSWGPQLCALEGYTGVYTNVAYFHDWIEENKS